MSLPLPRLVAFDLDGTLAESKQRMSADMGERLSKLLARIPVAVMSGAGLPQFERQFFPALSPEADLSHLYLFPDNAAQCYLYKHGEWRPQYDHAFSGEEKERITLALYQVLDEVGLREAPVRVWGERIEDRGAQEAFSPLGQQAPLADKQAWHDANNELRMALRDKLAAYLPDFSIAAGGLTTIDVTRRGITKAYGIQRLVKLTGIPIGDMLYIGDALEEGGNDAVVKETGIRARAVFGPDETAVQIDTLLARLLAAPRTF